MAVLGMLLVAFALFSVWGLEGVVRGGTCGAAEGGGSCSPGPVSWLLLAGAVAALLAAAAIAIRRRGRKR